ncbi:serine/arginine-rich splicing factor 11 isoform X2 [Canis lupus baileyi]|uniref:serine/arginine-rich splicing factor 11 isoform X3 n=1 Tax=Canis lupus dingo TaxID=286419 RepID=UPI000DC69C8E|nr:serine/arginine-rich splicing factor 11 isoform X3 [Canis lupus dingo]XP_038397598.1 serine/arginine-rich splicing factor 11 isoform X9 [Canis lupus familiaris]XP_038413552.1 serine/arginine-rich splicing factor 11 isoform X12 [Canis lupus familiaris]XP_041603973.1 serine/arginine-rich splicing factor 11 isoform X3 [Vulpes lagopus]
MSSSSVVPGSAGPGPSGGPGGGGGGTEVIQVTNVSPSASSEQMRTLFGFLGKIDELRLFPPDDSPLPVSSRVCFVKFHDPDSAVVAQHLTNTVFVDRALIVVPYAEGVIPDETKALSLLAPANAVAGLLPGGGLLPTPNPLTQIGAVPLAALGAPTLDPALAALGLPGANLNSQSLAADQLLKLMSTVDPKLNHVAAGLVSPSLKSDTSSKEIEEAMKRVREAQSLISAAIEPDKKEEKRRHSRSRSRSRRRRTPSSSRHRRSRSRSRRRSHSKSRSRRRSKSPRRRRSHSRERGRRSRSTSKTRERRRRRSRSGTRSPKKPRSPKRKLSRSPSPRRHKKEKKKDKDKERSRDERERSTSKKKKSKDKEKDRERKSESDKDVKQVTRDYDEEEQGYDSEKEKKEEKKAAEPSSPKTKECSVEKGPGDALRESKVNGDDHHEEDMDMSD